MQAQQAQPQHHEWEGSAIVEPAFSGQAEPYTIPVKRRLDLNVRGQYRIGGSEDRAKKDGRPERKPQSQDPDRGDQGHGQGHGHKGQAKR